MTNTSGRATNVGSRVAEFRYLILKLQLPRKLTKTYQVVAIPHGGFRVEVRVGNHDHGEGVFAGVVTCQVCQDIAKRYGAT